MTTHPNTVSKCFRFPDKWSERAGLLSANPQPSCRSREPSPQRPAPLKRTLAGRYGNHRKNLATFARTSLQRFAVAGSLLYSKYDPANSLAFRSLMWRPKSFDSSALKRHPCRKEPPRDMAETSGQKSTCREYTSTVHRHFAATRDRFSRNGLR